MESGKKLFSNLLDLKEEYEKLRSTVQEKQTAIIDRDLDKIQDFTRQEQVLSAQLRELGARQRELWLEICGCDDEELENMELDELLENMEEQTRQRYVQKRTELKFVLRDIQRINSENMELLKNRLSDLDSLFNTVFEELGADEGDGTYDKRLNDTNKKQKTSVLIDRAI
jgi:hypothetical protein